MAINTGKVITGGLLAGLVFNAFDIIANMTLFAADNEAMVKRLNLNPAAATDFSYAIPWIVVDFLMGLLVVWTYASIRPRYGPGPATAIRAGLIPFLAVSFVLYGFASLGIFDMAFYVKGTVFALVNTVIGSVIGAWAYKE